MAINLRMYSSVPWGSFSLQSVFSLDLILAMTWLTIYSINSGAQMQKGYSKGYPPVCFPFVLGPLNLFVEKKNERSGKYVAGYTKICMIVGSLSSKPPS